MTRGIRSFRVRGAVPGVTVRLLVVMLVWIGVLLLNPFALWQGVAVVASLVAVVLPRSLAAWVGAACLAFGVIVTEPSPERTALAVLLVHAIHLLASLGLVIPLSSRLSPAVLLPSLSRFVVVQLLSQPLVFGVWLLTPSQVERGIAWLAPVAALMLVIGLLLALRAARAADGELSLRAEGGTESAVDALDGADVRDPS